ncbi:transmembrane protein 53-like [Macrosteles quadrilineatus]|uniref:transmembrane protein 53-like n=1 Tax=Macrosteles quadrilineatus TaxID=74068 RepID=UPI0023E25D4B|nr:transmembrane protein 53-like [Macrosteles quadrilineatus]
MMSQIRALSRQALSKSLELVTADSVKVTQGRLVNDTPRPLVVLLSWMLAQKKHINKYCEFYVNRGCNVLTISITPWQLLFPVTGSQVVADEVLSFLDQNSTNEPLFVHGFSVGGYVWGEVMVKMKQDLERYEHIVNRFVDTLYNALY